MTALQSEAADAIWARPTPGVTAEVAGRGTFDRGNSISVSIEPRTVEVDPDALRPIDLAQLPERTLVSLFDSGVVCVDQSGVCESPSGKPLLAALVDDDLVVMSVWEQPGLMGVEAEALVPWLPGGEGALQLVHYVPAEADMDPHGISNIEPSLIVGKRRLLNDIRWPFDVSLDILNTLELRGSLRATAVDVLYSHEFSLGGWFLHERAAEVIAGTPAHPFETLVLPVAGEATTMAYLALPYTGELNYQLSTWAFVSDSKPPRIVERLGSDGPADLAAFRATNSDLITADDERSLIPNVMVVPSAPIAFQPIGSPTLLRADAATRARAAGLVGLKMSTISPFVLVRAVK